MFTNIITHMYQVGVAAASIMGIFTAFILWRTNNDKTASTKYLALVVLSLSLSVLSNALLSVFLNTYEVRTIRITDPFLCLFGPLLYFQLNYVLGQLLSKKQILLHLGLFFIVLLAALLFIFDLYGVLQSHWITHLTMALSLLAYVQIWVYFLLCRSGLKRYSHSLQSSCSTIDEQRQSWINQSLLALLVAFTGTTLVYFLNHLSITLPINQSITLIVCAILWFVVYITLSKPAMLMVQASDNPQDVILVQPEQAEKYTKSLLSETALTTSYRDLETFMQTHKPFLNAELNLSMLASEFGVNNHILSQVINSCAEMNFYEFINQYRLDEIKQYLSNPELHSRTVIDLAFTAGFNSKATFNRLFKLSTGDTPSTFRKKHI